MDKSDVVPKSRCDFLQDFQQDIAVKFKIHPGPPGFPVVNPVRSLKQMVRMTDVQIL